MLTRRLLGLNRTIKLYTKRNRIILNNIEQKTVKNTVNLHYYYMVNNNGEKIYNLGDYLSKIVVDYMKVYNNINDNSSVLNKTKHLYAVGSILPGGYQDATIWGSGFLNDVSEKKSNIIKYFIKYFRELDIRSVRGPETANILKKWGYKCPDVYGDPVILMPLIYSPFETHHREEKSEYSVVKHMHDTTVCNNSINILTTDYKTFIDKIVSSKRVISSSLHGIIIAESYGVPAVLYLPDDLDNTLFKYKDYYYSTGRMSFPIAKTIDEARSIVPCNVPDLKEMQENVFKAFPVDLWR